MTVEQLANTEGGAGELEQTAAPTMVVVDGRAVFDADLEAFENWCFFLPKGPNDEEEHMGEYVKWRGIRNPNFFDVTVRRLKELTDMLRIETKTTAGIRPETLLSAKWSCLETQRVVVGFLQNRQLRKAQILAEESSNLIEFCCRGVRDKTGLLFLLALCRMGLGVVYRHARRYEDAVSILNQNFSLLGQPQQSSGEDSLGEEWLRQIGPKELALIGACHAHLQFTHMANGNEHLAANHAGLAVEVFESHLWDVPADDKDSPQKTATLAAAYGNAGVLAIRQGDLEAALEWLGKARTAMEDTKGMNTLRDTIRDQYDHACTLRQYSGAQAAEAPTGGEPDSADGRAAGEPGGAVAAPGEN